MQLTMKEIQQQLEFAINRTPTGVKRNLLCDANIMLCQAILLDEQVDGGVPVAESTKTVNLGHLTAEKFDAAADRAFGIKTGE